MQLASFPSDRFFTDIAEKFDKNIYGTTKGRLRHQLLLDALAPLLGAPAQKIIDIGGGSGVMSAAFASAGHEVVLSDAAEDILRQAQQNFAHVNIEQSNITVRQQTLLQIDDLAHFDVLICHAVLEWLSEPFAALAHFYANMRDGAHLSLSFFNRDAAVMANAVYGNFDYIKKGMKVRNQVRLNPQQPLSPTLVIEELTRLGFTVVDYRGIRCFHDYLRDLNKQQQNYDELLELERTYNQKAPFCWLGRYFHILVRR